METAPTSSMSEVSRPTDQVISASARRIRMPSTKSNRFRSLSHSAIELSSSSLNRPGAAPNSSSACTTTPAACCLFCRTTLPIHTAAAASTKTERNTTTTGTIIGSLLHYGCGIDAAQIRLAVVERIAQAHAQAGGGISEARQVGALGTDQQRHDGDIVVAVAGGADRKHFHILQNGAQLRFGRNHLDIDLVAGPEQA